VIFRWRQKRIALTIGAFLSFLAIVNQASLFIAPCNYFSGAEAEQHKENNSADYKCTTKDGIIVQGISLLSEIRPEVWAAISSVLIAVFTLTLWLATDRLWRSSLDHARHLGDTRRVMRQTARRQLRAYVFVNGGSITLVGGQGNTFDLIAQSFPTAPMVFVQVHTVFKNCGQTPGYDFRIRRKVDIFDTDAPCFTEISDRTDPQIVGPDIEIDITALRQIDREEFEAVKSGVKSIFSWGQIDYVDVFGDHQFYRFYHVNGPMRVQG
jgi:hypothetical protein